MEGKSALLYKSLVVGVIILFIGIGVQPAFAVTSNSIENENDCDLCPKKVSKSQLTLLENSLIRLEKYDNQLSILSKQYPEFEEKYKGAYDKLLIFKEVVTEFKHNPSNSNNIFICLSLLIPIISGMIVLVILNPIYWKYEDNLVINIILSLFQIPFGFMALGALALGEKLNCWDIPWPPIDEKIEI
jgi:hypothetical protein